MTVPQSRFRMNANLHLAFMRELRRLDRALASADLSDPDEVSGLRRRFSFFADVLHTHHEAEDEFLWPKAMANASGGEQAVLSAMEAEHSQMAAALQAVSADFGSLGPDTDVASVRSRMSDLATVLAGHCEHEERDAVPIVAEYIDDADMKRLVAHSRSAPNADLVLPWVCDGAPSDVVAATWAEIPAVPRLFVKAWTTRKYRRFTAECGI